MALKINDLYINFKQFQRSRINKPTKNTWLEDKKDEEGNVILDEQGNPVQQEVSSYDHDNTIDTLYFDLYVNVYPYDDRSICQVVKTVVEIPYSETTTDEQIYNELKGNTIKIKDGFGRDIEIDLGLAEDVFEEGQPEV